MKCPNCGSNLTIDDEKCSFCGEANPFAVKHRREMYRFTKEFNKTKAEVMQKSGRVNYWAVKITLIAVMVALNLGMLFVINNMYDLQRFFKEREIAADYPEHKAELDRLEAGRNYKAFHYYWTNNELYHSKLLDEYSKVAQLCNYYSILHQHTMDILTREETEYFKYEEAIRYVAEYADYIYKYAVQHEYDNKEQFKASHRACMDDLIVDMENLIKAYYGITDEEMETFSELSSARRQILLEEGMMRYEQAE